MLSFFLSGEMSMLRASAALMFLTSACASVNTGDRGRSLWLIGITRVILPSTEGRLAAVEISTLGAGWDNGPFLGWKAGNWVIADPADCQLLIVIRSPAAAENAAKVLQALKGQQPCVADYTHSLQR